MQQSTVENLSSLACIQNAIRSFNHLYQVSSLYELIRIEVSLIELMSQNTPLYLKYQSDICSLLSALQYTLLSSLNTQMTEYQHSLLQARTHIKLVHFPYTAKIYKIMDGLSQNDFGHWIILEGKIIRALKKTLQKSKLFKCSTCGHIERCYSTYHNNYIFQPPKSCPNIVQKDKSDNFITKMYQKINYYKHKHNANHSKEPKQTSKEPSKKQSKCNNKKFQTVQDTEFPENKIFVNYQQLKIQEPFKHITTRGRIPNTITVVLEGLFEEVYRPGEDIVVSGLFTSRFQKLVKGNKLDEEVIIVANNITVKKLNQTKTFEEEEDEETILSGIPTNKLFQEQEVDEFISKEVEKRNHILSLFCPSIYQRDHVKLALILCSIGGINQQVGSTRIRGQSHLLLVGEPGTGKSVLLKAAADLSERSFFTNGISSSTAGLTVSHIRCGNEWMIEAGALVLADNGVCCIDEINLMAVKDQQSLLEAMEQQTVSSAKAGIIGKLNCRTTVIAACNPIRPGQKFDIGLSVSINTGLIVPLVTRFDLVIVLNDTPNIEQDSDKCDLLLGKFLQKQDSYLQNRQQKKQFVTLKTILRRAKNFEPTILQEDILTSYFIKIRQKNSEKTVRTFESLCRLSEAHARLMFREETTEFDCISVIMLMEGWHASTLQEYQQCKRKIELMINS